MSALDVLAAVIRASGPIRSVRVSSVVDLSNVPGWSVMLGEIRLNRHDRVTSVPLGETMSDVFASRLSALLVAERVARQYCYVTCSVLGKLDDRQAVAILHQLDEREGHS